MSYNLLPDRNLPQHIKVHNTRLTIKLSEIRKMRSNSFKTSQKTCKITFQNGTLNLPRQNSNAKWPLQKKTQSEIGEKYPLQNKSTKTKTTFRTTNFGKTFGKTFFRCVFATNGHEHYRWKCVPDTPQNRVAKHTPKKHNKKWNWKSNKKIPDLKKIKLKVQQKYQTPKKFLQLVYQLF